MMAVDLQSGESSLPTQFLPDKDDDILSQDHNPSNNNGSALTPQVHPHEFGSHISSLVHSSEVQRNDKDDDFIAELTSQMAHFMFQDDDKFDFSGIRSDNLEMSWDLTDSPKSTFWSSLGSNQGSPEGPSQEPTPPATPGDSKDSCWESNYDVIGMSEKMNLDERGHSKYLHGYGNQSFKNSNVGLCCNQALIDEQIRAIQLSRLKQDQVLKQKSTACRESQAHISPQSEPKEQIQQGQKKGKSCGAGSGNGRRNRPQPLFSSNTWPAPLQQLQSKQQASSGMRAVFLGGSGSRSGSCGTGVFLPRGTSAPSESRKKPGCSPVLIPARVVQALQLHFDQMAATSGPKAGGFPPLHDVLVNNKDGMYSLQQKRQSRKAPANIQNEMMLPQEWTY